MFERQQRLQNSFSKAFGSSRSFETPVQCRTDGDIIGQCANVYMKEILNPMPVKVFLIDCGSIHPLIE